MVRWEYIVRVFALEKEDEVVVQYVQSQYPDDPGWKELPRYDPLALEAWLNEAGKDGWELVSIESAEKQGKNGDIGSTYPPSLPGWRRVFMCVFKRQASF
jgi:hypothetical protein